MCYIIGDHYHKPYGRWNSAALGAAIAPDKVLNSKRDRLLCKLATKGGVGGDDNRGSSGLMKERSEDGKGFSRTSGQDCEDILLLALENLMQETALVLTCESGIWTPGVEG